MAYSQDELINIGGVLAVLFGVMVRNNLKAIRDARRPAVEPKPSGPPFLGKYAQHDGSIMGKVIAIEGDELVIEQSGTTRRVPLSQARDAGHDVILTGDLGSV